MPRRARLDAPGTLHHVIVRGIERREIVRDAQDRAPSSGGWARWRPRVSSMASSRPANPARSTRTSWTGVSASAVTNRWAGSSFRGTAGKQAGDSGEQG